MVRKGWTHVEVPNGWVQLIRGPRPKSVQWPRAHDRKPQQPQRHIGGQRQGDRLGLDKSGKPTLFDMTIDDSEEVSGGASRVRRRRRLVLVPTQLESTRPTVEDTDCPQTHVDGSDTESWDGNDPQSQDEHPHSDESVVSSRMGASVAEERGSDQEAEEDDLHTHQVRFFPDVAPSLPVLSLWARSIWQKFGKSEPF